MKNIYQLLTALLIVLFFTSTSFAQNNLAAGDLAIVSYQSDEDLTNTGLGLGGTSDFDDRFSIVVLKNGGLAAGTVIYFTDRGWDGPNSTWLDNATVGHEAVIKWVVPAGGIVQGKEVYFISHLGPSPNFFETWTSSSNEAGTITLGVVTSETDPATDGGGMGFTVSGDEVLVYQTGPTAGPAGAYNATPIRFITALLANLVANSTTSAGWDATPVTLNESSLPPGLTNGQTAFVMSPSTLPTATVDGTSEPDNGKYKCTGSSPSCSALQLSTTIYTVANWTFSNSAFATGTTSSNCTYSITTIVVTNPSVTTGNSGTPFSQTFTASGGTGSYTFATTSTLPTGLTLSTAGVLGGTPTQTGTFSIVVKATDPNCSASGATYTLVIGAPLTSQATDYFRTITSGNWSAPATWESATDAGFTTGLVSPATLSPNFNANAITIRNTHTVTVTSNITTDQTTINSGGSLVVNPGIVLTLNDGTGTDLTVSSGGSMTIKSTLAGTGSIGNSTTATITGDVTVERYISDKRAWRLLGVPFSASNQTIKTSWMEGPANSTSNPVPGYGTHITTFTGDGNSAGFDAVKPASSIRTYLTNTFTSDGTHTPPTTTNIAANQAYFLFVRGNRSIDLNTATAHSATTLRITGTITTGAVTKGVTGTNSLIPNPYPSAIDFDVVKASNSSIGIFYVWDATLAGPSGVGQYRTVQISGSGPNYTYTATPGSADNKWRYIESGTAFFIQGSGTVNFTEAMKTAGIPPSSMLRVTSPNQTELAVNLNIVNADNTTSLADGVREVFDNSYSTAIDNNDAKKIAGFNLNLGISSNSEILAIEKRPLPNANDVITLSLSNMAQGNYQFELQPANLPGNLTAYLKDNYLGTYTPIDLTADTKINFSITADAASSAASRFSIVFGKPQLVNPNSLITVYPNPVSNGVVTLQMNNMPKGVYQVRLLNAVGQTILTKQINHSGGSSTETFNVNKVKGTYTIEVTKPDNSKINSKIIFN